MKRFGYLYNKVYDFENLLSSARQAAYGKRFRPDVSEFQYELERELLELSQSLKNKSYQPGDYHTFYIHDPKKRLISAAPFRDRVVHHALCRVIEPCFESQFIYHSYANRTGKGSHKALDQCTALSEKYRYVLKCDIEKYFPSIDHQILYELIQRRIKCRDTLWLIKTIIDNSNPQEHRIAWFPGDDLFTPAERRHGIPIGNLTSQYFANVYLNGFDHYIKETMQCRAYIRYVDDFVIFSDNKDQLHEFIPVMQEYLNTLRLKLHPRKCQVSRVNDDVPFLGWQVFPDRRRLKRKTGVRIQRKVKILVDEYHQNLASVKDLKASLASWQGHLKHGNTGALQMKLLKPVQNIIDHCETLNHEQAGN
jgi:retron-type reverse transcriptase